MMLTNNKNKETHKLELLAADHSQDIVLASVTVDSCADHLVVSYYLELKTTSYHIMNSGEWKLQVMDVHGQVISVSPPSHKFDITHMITNQLTN